MDETTLKAIAKTTNAIFFRAHDKRQLASIYTEIDKLEKTEVKLRHLATYKDYFYGPALLGLILVALEQLLSQTRYRRLP